MSGLLSRRVFPILQLARMALVFTAISNSLCTLMLATHARYGGAAGDAAGGAEGGSLLSQLSRKEVAAVVLISTGLYGFGMSLNDIIDRRRDQQIAAHRPLPSGRIGVGTAHIVCALLITAALAGGAWYAQLSGQGWIAILLVVFTAALIVFYDLAGKYLVAPGLLTLGLIRFFHAIVPAPQLPVLWHPLLLMTHVTVISLVAYRWEEKRPALTPIHWVTVTGGLAVVDAMLIGLLAWRRIPVWGTFAKALKISPALIAPAALAAAFIGLAFYIRAHSASSREAGQRLMLYGLLWLILYDAAFVAAYADWRPALILLALLPMAYISVQVMRWWGGVIALSHRPAFKRADA